MEFEDNIYRFLTKEEIIEIVSLIEKTKSDDIKSRFYLLTLGYRQIDIQKFELSDAQKIINDNNLPEYIIEAFRNSLNNRKKTIKEKDLKVDTKYLFVNQNNRQINDCHTLRDWRKFLKENNLNNINLNIYRQSINYLKLNDRYHKNKMKEYEMEV